MTQRQKFLLLICLIALLPATAGRTFRTAELGRLAMVLAVDVDALPDGYSYPTARGLRLTIHVNNCTVDHIGRQLFTEEFRQQVNTPVLDFLERYFLQLKFPPEVKTATMMTHDDGFHFLKGSMATVDGLRPTDDFSYSYDQRHYRATWSRSGKELLSVWFPVEYELISGENKIEAENNLTANLQSTRVTEQKDPPRMVDEATYMTKDFSNHLYRAGGSLVASERHPAETTANMMLSLQAARGYSLNITQVCYGFKKAVFSIALQQWITFCRNNGCELYFGLEDISRDKVEAVVIAVNEQENYNHVLTVSVPIRAISQRHGVIDARLYPYVPTHNIRNLFAAYQKSNPKHVEGK